MANENLLPIHGRLNCSRCFKDGVLSQKRDQWCMRRDPGAWGSSYPKYLVLGFSKGSTQADIYANGNFDDVAFGGEITRRNLTNILRKVGLLKSGETVDSRICATEKEFHFGSLVRCSLSRYDEQGSSKRGRPVCKTSGPLITKSFSEIPKVIDQCVSSFLARLPNSLRLIIVLGVTDSYIRNIRKKMKELHPDGFREINRVAYENNRLLWVHLTHPSKGNGTLNAWLSSDSDNGSGRKRELAIEALRQKGLCRIGC